MAESNDKMSSNMERVLRAMDVIPPFDNVGEQNDSAGADFSEKTSARSQVGQGGRRVAGKAQDVGQPPVELDNGVPTLDLGEKILAEQRRVTAGRRRAPGSVPALSDSLPKCPVRPTPKLAGGPTPPEELAHLQLIVADIVARDIERLCAGPRRAFG